MARPTDDELALHERLVSGDVTAPAELAHSFLGKLERTLRRQFPQVTDDGLIYDAATDAVLSYIRQPASYDPSRRSLAGYLKMAAIRDLQNRLPRFIKRAQKEIGLDFVEDLALGRNKRGGKRTAANTAEVVRISAIDTRSKLKRVLHTLTDATDRKLVRLMLAGERSFEPYAKVLNICDLESREQQVRVKQNKDRILKRLQRDLGPYEKS
jgi:hypothetical protein